MLMTITITLIILKVCLVNVGPIACFSEAKLLTSSNKHLEELENLYIVSLIHKLLSSSANSTDLLYGFGSSITYRRHK